MENIFKQENMLSTKEILKDYPQIRGRFYHGAPKNVDNLLPPNQTGFIRKGEEGRRLFKDVIFLTTDLKKAIEYSGNEGTVFITDSAAVKYKDIASDLLDERKVKTVNDDIFIALPEDIKIVAKWHKEKDRKRGEPVKFDDEYVGEQEK